MTETTQLDPGHVYVQLLGLVNAGACAPVTLTPEQVAAEVNGQMPTGITSRWAVAESPLEDGTPNPQPCADDPDRRHYLLNC